MARPAPKILKQVDVKEVTWQILEADKAYIVLYKGRPTAIRAVIPGLGKYKLKYYKMTYTNLSSVKNAVNRLNKKFNTTEFSYSIMA